MVGFLSVYWCVGASVFQCVGASVRRCVGASVQPFFTDYGLGIMFLTDAPTHRRTDTLEYGSRCGRYELILKRMSLAAQVSALPNSFVKCRMLRCSQFFAFLSALS